MGDMDDPDQHTEYPTTRSEIGDQMAARLKGFDPHNLLNVDVALEGADGLPKLDPASLSACLSARRRARLRAALTIATGASALRRSIDALDASDDRSLQGC